MNTPQNVTPGDVADDVIIDLATLYFAGEASAASRALVERYFAQHPELAAALRASQGAAAGLGALPAADTNSSHATLLRLRRLLRLRSSLMGVAIFCSLAPLSFTVGMERNWSMLRDAPASALAYGVAAVIAWVGYAIVARKTRTP